MRPQNIVELVIIARRIRNGIAMLSACRTPRERVAMLAVLTAHAAAVGTGRALGSVTVTVDGLRLTLDWAGAEHVPIREVLGRREYELADAWAPRVGQTVVDVGANAGIFTCYAARGVGALGRVVAIEPNPALTERIHVNLRQNDLAERVSVVPVAVADVERGEGRLLLTGNTTTARLELGEDRPAHGTAVAVRTLDGLLAELGIGAVDLMKIDVEGSEERVVAGAEATIRSTRRIAIEADDEGVAGRLAERLRAAGFPHVVTRRSGPDSGAWLVFAERA